MLPCATRLIPYRHNSLAIKTLVLCTRGKLVRLALVVLHAEVELRLVKWTVSHLLEAWWWMLQCAIRLPSQRLHKLVELILARLLAG